MHNSRAGRASQVFQLMDPRTLSGLICEVTRGSGGSLRQAWLATNEKVLRRTGRRPRTGIRPVDYATIQRLKAGKTRRLKQSTVTWLLLFLPQPYHDRFYATIFSPAAQQRLSLHDYWLQRETDYATRGVDNGPIAAEMAKIRAARSRDLLAEVKELEKEAFNRFATAARQHRPGRVKLAYLVLLAPFLAARETGGIERSWDELSDNERKRYIKAALRQQTILLDRPSDFHRVQNQTTPGQA